MKRIISFILVLCVVASAVPVISNADDTSSVSLSIKACNLVFEDSVRMLFAVSAAGAGDVYLRVWDSAPASYSVDTAGKTLSPLGTDTVLGAECWIFKYSDLAAKQMTDTVYAMAYTTVGGQTYCSEPCRYSIIEYASNKLGRTGTASSDSNYQDMLTGMLSYGAGAQKYFNYKTDRLATDTFYKISVTNGTIDGYFDYGIYKSGENVTISAPDYDSNGTRFHHWINSSGNSVDTTLPLTVKASGNETYTAVYAEPTTQYTITWNADEDPNAIINVYNDQTELKSGDKVNCNDVLKITYVVNEGNILSKGDEYITVTRDIGPRDIYCISDVSYGQYTVKFKTTDGIDLGVTATTNQKQYSTAVPHCEFPTIDGYILDSSKISAIKWDENNMEYDEVYGYVFCLNVYVPLQ